MNTTEQPVAIVTGASSGIGLGITQALLDRGWNVVGTSRTISKSKDLKPSPELVLVDGEASKKQTATEVADAADTHFGRIDLLVNNAGIFIPKPFGLHRRRLPPRGEYQRRQLPLHDAAGHTDHEETAFRSRGEHLCSPCGSTQWCRARAPRGALEVDHAGR